MTPGAKVIAEVEALAQIAAALPAGAAVTVEWQDAPPDLLLLLASQEGGEISEAAGQATAEWHRGGITVRAVGAVVKPRPRLRLVR